MRISNPKLFNGQTLATKQQISGGLITIPSASILGLSELAAAVSANTANISTISGSLGTRAEALSGTAWGNISDIWGKLSELTGQDMTGGGLNLGSLDQRLTNVQTKITVPSGTYSYITSGDVVANNLVALDTHLDIVSGDLDELEAAVGELSGKFDAIDHKTLTIGNTTYDTTSAAVVTTDDLVVLGALTGVAAGNAGIKISEKDKGQVSASIVVKTDDSYLEVGANGLQTKNLNIPADGEYNYINAPNYVSGNLVELDRVLGSIKLSKLEQATSGYASSYQLMVNGEAKGATINIPKDQFLSGATYNTATEQLEFTFIINKKDDNGELTSTPEVITVDAKDLVHEYVAGDGIYVGNTVSGTSVISAVIDTNSESFLTVGTKGLKLSGVSDAIFAAVSGKAEISTVNGIDDRLKVAESALTGKAEISTVNDIAGRLQIAENALAGVSNVSSAIETAVSEKADKGAFQTVSEKVEEHTTSIDEINTLIGTGAINVQGTSDIISAINQTYDVASAAKTSAEEAGAAAAVAKAAADAAQGAADDAQSSADAAQQSANDAQSSADSAQQSADAAAASINELSGTVLEHAITFEEVSLSELELTSSVIVEGRIMQVFDDAGWVYPEVKFTTSSGIVSSTVTITEWDTISAEDKPALAKLSGLVSKKVAAIATIPAE